MQRNDDAILLTRVQPVADAVLAADGSGFELPLTKGLLDAPGTPPGWTVGTWL